MSSKNRVRSKVLAVVVSLVVFCGWGSNFLVVSADEAKAGAQNETTKEKSFNELISEKNQLSKYIDHKSGRFSLRKYGDNPESSYGTVINIEEYRDEAEKLYSKVIGFVKDSDAKGVTAENFEEYVKNFIINDGRTCSKMTRSSQDEFEKMKEQPEKFQIVYRGVPEKSYADSLLDGQFWCGGQWHCNFLKYSVSASKHGLYTASDSNYAKNFAKKNIKNKSCDAEWRSIADGGVVEMAIDLQKAKIICEKRLENIINTMLCLHPELADSYKLFNKMVPEYLVYSSVFELYSQAFKETFGFDVLDIRQHLENELIKLGKEDFTADKIKAAHDDECYTDLEDDILGYAHCFLNFRVEESKQFCSRFNELMEKNKTKVHVTNKFFAVLQDKWLLAKLMGFDVISDADMAQRDRDPKVVVEYGIVNPEVLIVCNDLFDLERMNFFDWVKKEYSARQK